MANQAGKSGTLSIESATPSSYLALGGITTRSIRANAAPIDVTDSDSTDLFQELLDGGGLKSFEISVSGHSKDDSAIERMRVRFLTGALSNFRALIPSWQLIEGAFFISSLEITMNHDGAVDYSATFTSSGKPTFTAQ